MTKHRIVVVGTCLLFTGAAAAQPTKHECIASNEDGQDLRRAGRLRAAVERFEACAVSACPGPLREDCAERLKEARAAMPSIIFVAKDQAGHPVTNVRVTVNGAPLAERLDGAPVNVEPGEHTFDLAAAGFTAVSRRIDVREGMKPRREVIVFEPIRPASSAEPERVVGPQSPSSRDAHASANDGSFQRTVGIALGGLGLVGAAVGAGFGLSANANHDAATKACPQPSLCSSQEIVDQGNSARDQAMLANVAFVASGALLIGGIVLYVSGPRPKAMAVGLSGAGVSLGGAW